MKEKINQKGFIPIPVVIIITILTITIGVGTVLYETKRVSSFNNVVDGFFDFTSDVIYKVVWQSKFEKQILESELELSNIKRDQAENKANEEAIARVEAEEKAQQEEVLKNQAEAKAKQEEYEKKLREQELSEKEAEEKKMNADNDNDGLTYREEQSLGTSDWSDDSDGDSIKDKEDVHPAGGGRYLAQNFEWVHDDTLWTWTYSIHEDWYEYYKNKPRTSHGLEYITEDDPFIIEMAEMFKESAERKGYVVTLFITSFVQSLPYVQDAYISFDDYPKYPIETFVERNGDCEDTSYLAASLVDASGYGSALVELPNHMAIAIKASSGYNGNYYEMGDGRYYYFETTGEGWELGDMPPEYEHQRAKITKVWDGSVYYKYPQYKRPCDYSPDFSGYYTDGNYYHSDSNCNNLVYCLLYEGFYYNYSTENFYWDTSCSQIFVEGCYKSKTYSGKFYKSGSAWYYDSECKQLYKSMACDYPSSYTYSCAYESSYNIKKSTCDYYKSSSYLSDLADGCYEKLAQCRRDIDEYQRKLDEYNQCKDRKEY